MENQTVVNPIQVEKFLKNVDYPATKQELVDTAKKEGADENVIWTLEHLEGNNFNGPVGISRAIGKLKQKSK
jgi:hypothetical protein